MLIITAIFVSLVTFLHINQFETHMMTVENVLRYISIVFVGSSMIVHPLMYSPELRIISSLMGEKQ